MNCLDIQIPRTNTLVSVYNDYRSAIKGGYKTVALSLKSKLLKLRLEYKYDDCDDCTKAFTCVSGCFTILNRCTPTITEYTELISCINANCVHIEEV